MTFDQAAEALAAANREDGAAPTGEAGQGASNPAGDWQPSNPLTAEESKPDEPATVTPEGESQEATPAEPEDSFTKLDPNAIPEELRPYYQSMQADYTRKTQEVAEARKQLEGMDPEEARVAVELLHSLGTPEGALTFHQLLSEQLQSLGLTPAEAQAAATQQMQQQLQQPQVPSFDEDPEAALKYQFDQLQGELQTMRDEIQAERTQAAQEAQYFQLAGEISRQEAIVRDANPHYTDDDMNAVYEIAAAYGGNLVQAQQRYESIVSDRVSRLLNSKQAAAADRGVQAPSAGAAHAETPPHFDTLEQAHAAAQEYLRQVEAQG